MKDRSRKRKTKEENMEIIKHVTFKLLKKKGYVNLSVNEIADVSGINISQVYSYFPNGKPDILIAIGSDILKSGAPKPSFTNLKKPRKFLIRLIKFLIDTHRANKLMLKVLKVVFLSYPKLLQKDKDLFLIGLSEFKYFEDFIEKLGVYDADKRKEIAKFVFHLVDSMIHRHVLEVEIAETDDALAQSLSDSIMRYLQPFER
jgi:AcrR family transcriptional regulator